MNAGTKDQNFAGRFERRGLFPLDPQLVFIGALLLLLICLIQDSPRVHVGSILILAGIETAICIRAFHRSRHQFRWQYFVANQAIFVVLASVYAAVQLVLILLAAADHGS